jgi:hypothetical protein
MTSTAIVALATNNTVNYTEMLTHAHDLGASIKTGRERQRKLARSFILAAVDDDYQLEGLIEDAKAKLKWPKLEADERNRLGVFFTACRKVVGVWSKLTPEVQQQFRDGKIVYSTLVTSIKEAEKAAEKAEAEAERVEEQAQEASKLDDKGQAPSVLAEARAFIEARQFSPADLAELVKLADALDALRAEFAKPALAQAA